MVLPRHPLLPLRVSFEPLLQEYRLPLAVHFPLTEESNEIRVGEMENALVDPGKEWGWGATL